MSKIYVVMPAYNEEGNIEYTINQWLPVVKKIGKNARLVIFDDGSTDGTFRIMIKMKKQHPELIPISKENTGHGPTCYEAYKYCFDNDVDYIFQTDSDGQTDPNDFWDFYAKSKEADFVIGYRNNREDGEGRKFISFVLKAIILIIFGVKIKDANTPFRLMKTRELRKILPSIESSFFLVNVLISIAIVKRKGKCAWLPISFKSRSNGISTINKSKITRIGLSAINEFYQFKRNYSKNETGMAGTNN